MLRRMIARLATSALIAGLVVVASPPASQAAGTYQPWGSASSKNHVLRRGCHEYGYRYTITAPSNDWLAEIRFVSPNGEGLAAATLLSGSNSDRGRRELTVCRSSAPYGRYKIAMKVTWYRGLDSTAGRVKPSFFRFTKRR